MLTHTRAGEVWESDALIMGDYFTHDFQVEGASFSHQMYLSWKTHGLLSKIWTFIKLSYSINNRNIVSLLIWDSKRKINLLFLLSFTLDLIACSGTPIFCKEYHTFVSSAAWTFLSYNHIFTGSHANNCVEQLLSYDYPAMIICDFVSHSLKLDLSDIFSPHVVLCKFQLHG